MLTRREMLAASAAMSSLSLPKRARASDRDLLVTVITCPRPHGENYLPGTLDAIDAELSSHPRLLICDGPEPAPRDGWTHAVMPPREKRPHRGPDNKSPGWVALTTAANMGRDLLFCEDDIRPVAPGAFGAMASHRVAAGADFATFFGAGYARNVGLYRARRFELSQAVLLPLAAVERLLAASHRTPSLFASVTGVDLAISALANSEGMHFETDRKPNPSRRRLVCCRPRRTSRILKGHA
jgi:hypothetical protein